MVNKNIIVTLFVTAAAAVPQTGAAQKAAYNTPGAGNPILPGYFADPTIKKFGDTYYIYATTDGSGAGFGPAQLWCSKDFKNWTLMPMNWPDSHWIWAPDVMPKPTASITISTASLASSIWVWAIHLVVLGRTCWARAKPCSYRIDS